MEGVSKKEENEMRETVPKPYAFLPLMGLFSIMLIIDTDKLRAESSFVRVVQSLMSWQNLCPKILSSGPFSAWGCSGSGWWSAERDPRRQSLPRPKATDDRMP